MSNLEPTEIMKRGSRLENELLETLNEKHKLNIKKCGLVLLCRHLSEELNN